MAPTMAKATNQQNHKAEGMAKRIEVANEGGKNLKELPLHYGENDHFIWHLLL